MQRPFFEFVFRVPDDCEGCSVIKRAVTSFAALFYETDGNLVALSDVFNRTNKRVTCHLFIIGQICPDVNQKVLFLVDLIAIPFCQS